MTFDEIENARRVAKRGDARAQVGGEVEAEIAEIATVPRAEDAPRIEAAGAALRKSAVDEVLESDRDVRVARGLARASQVVNYLFGVVYVLLAMRFALALMAARSGAAFARFVMAVTDPLYEPFRAIIESEDLGTGHRVVLPIIVAIIVYLLLHLGVHSLFRAVAQRRSSV
jgi:uncharacterized protein YggT (Ycf19 family)